MNKKDRKTLAQFLDELRKGIINKHLTPGLETIAGVVGRTMLDVTEDDNSLLLPRLLYLTQPESSNLPYKEGDRVFIDEGGFKGTGVITLLGVFWNFTPEMTMQATIVCLVRFANGQERKIKSLDCIKGLADENNSGVA